MIKQSRPNNPAMKQGIAARKADEYINYAWECEPANTVRRDVKIPDFTMKVSATY